MRFAAACFVAFRINCICLEKTAAFECLMKRQKPVSLRKVDRSWITRGIPTGPADGKCNFCSLAQPGSEEMTASFAPGSAGSSPLARPVKTTDRDGPLTGCGQAV